jgi:hypothetical protein
MKRVFYLASWDEMFNAVRERERERESNGEPLLLFFFFLNEMRWENLKCLPVCEHRGNQKFTLTSRKPKCDTKLGNWLIASVHVYMIMIHGSGLFGKKVSRLACLLLLKYWAYLHVWYILRGFGIFLPIKRTLKVNLTGEYST